MKISNRLKTIANMIDDDSHVIDIGCDHALLDIYLVKNFKNIKCIASDINEKSLNSAISNIEKYACNKEIETILSDGLDNINVTTSSSIVISGMGTNTIKHILNNEKSLIAKKIIIQSNNDLYDLRLYMMKKGFSIISEKVVKEKGIYYVIICFIKGKQKYNNIELYIGPKIIEERKINREYLHYLKDKEEKKLKNIPKKYLMLRLKTYRKLKKIMRYI